MKNKANIIDLKKVGKINPTKEPLTVEKVKMFKGLENLSEEEAQEIVFAIQTLASILYEFMNEQELKKRKTESEIINQELKTAA